jgi:hypothetical protein
MHLVLSPVLLGRGERMMEGLDLPSLGYECTGRVAGEMATHFFFAKKSDRSDSGAAHFVP